MDKMGYLGLSDEEARQYDRIMFKKDRYRYFSQEVNERAQNRMNAEWKQNGAKRSHSDPR